MFLVLGVMLFIIAPKVSGWLPSYFGGAMTLSLIFVVLILLDQVLSSSQVLVPNFHYNWILLISELYQDIVLSVCEIALETGSGTWTNPNKDILFDLWVFQCLKLLPTGHKSTIYIALLNPVVRDLISPKYNLISSRVPTQQNPKHTEKAPFFFFPCLVEWRVKLFVAMELNLKGKLCGSCAGMAGHRSAALFQWCSLCHSSGTWVW